MRHITASIYISFGFLFYLLEGYDDFFGPDNLKWIAYLFVLIGFIYLFIDLRCFIKDKLK
ncbi:UNVERIFIED_ORG: hypothetical protein ABIC97_003167 [Peribacillus simplex]